MTWPRRTSFVPSEPAAPVQRFLTVRPTQRRLRRLRTSTQIHGRITARPDLQRKGDALVCQLEHQAADVYLQSVRLRARRDGVDLVAAGIEECRLTVGIELNADAEGVDRRMASGAQQCEVSERRLTTVGPVPEVVPLDEAAVVAAREATGAVTKQEGAAERGRDRPAARGRWLPESAGARHAGWREPRATAVALAGVLRCERRPGVPLVRHVDRVERSRRRALAGGEGVDDAVEIDLARSHGGRELGAGRGHAAVRAGDRGRCARGGARQRWVRCGRRGTARLRRGLGGGRRSKVTDHDGGSARGRRCRRCDRRWRRR